jgi:hypothetical protein
MDETLAYDATGVGPISYASSLGFDLASVMRIYLGGEDQLPDPAYVEFREAKYGPNSAPAFRGVSHDRLRQAAVRQFRQSGAADPRASAIRTRSGPETSARSPASRLITQPYTPRLVAAFRRGTSRRGA